MATKKKDLSAGDGAPEFATNDIAQECFDLSQETSQPVWLAFYRHASCPMCNIHFDDVVSRRNELSKNNIKFVAVFESPAANFHARLITERTDGIRVLADPSCTLYHQYGVENA